MIVSERLRQAMESCGIPRAEIARQTGISESTLSRYASGERGLRVEVLDQLAEFLGMELVSRRKPRAKRAAKPKAR